MIEYAKRHHVALLALFVAMGGTSYAAATGSIDSREIKNNSVRSKDIRTGGVGSSDVRNGSLLSRDFKSGQLPTGAPGPTGPGGSPAASFITGQVPQSEMPISDGGSIEGLAPSGLSSPSGSYDMTMLSPSRTIVLRDLAASLTVAPGQGAGRRLYVGVLQPNAFPSPSLSCQIEGTRTTCFSAGTATIPPGSRLTVLVQNLSGNSPAAANFKFGYRATIP